MTVKKLLALCTAVIATTTASAASDAEFTIDFVSAYVFRGADLGDESVQPGFGMSLLDGAISVGTWANFDIDSSEFNEIDYFFGIPIPLGEDSPVSAEFGYTEYVYNEGGEADREPYFSFGFADASLLLAYGIGGAIEDALYVELGYGTSVPVSEDFAIDLGAALGYLDPDEGESGFNHLTVSAGTAVAIPDTDFSISLGVTYIYETDEDVQPVDESFYFTVGTAL
jgi:uncharacterized protein (TIGR02001 family)